MKLSYIAMLVFLALAVSNFSYQYFTGEQLYLVALERSYFQGAAIVLMVIYNYFVGEQK